ncbi:hypothetical protein JNUCC1_02142 [Lentibacillus sp. JNUCC-1]|uniref:M23 family metallopeptidase n=1 Tax=Lentibacillus sp. JNUCC-1 TaxID=2654513 RepID=UPI0012E8AF06|nr:M23 family metallopeptidase [Lentibacillus sp. JNUCC-1]MUV38304.1 hypothetical protein [Lentibacillus sp. JNUCC-1]
MTFAIVQLLFFQVILPAVLVVSLLMGKFKGKLDWVLQAIMLIVYTSWVFFSGRWDWTSYYLRYLWPLILIVVLYVGWRRIRTMPAAKYTGKDKGMFVFYIALALLFGSYHIGIFSGYSPDEEAVELEFPLKNGTYYVGHGGASTSINYHNAHPEQRYALDVVQLNKLGIRTSGMYPEELDKYAIYGAKLSSPCAGTIIEARNDMPDLTPPEANPEKPEGNFVQIRCDKEDVNVLIAHMQEGSVTVQENEGVETGQLLGYVGNSGNTSEPHLHIHAERNGEGVPIQFDGRFLVRNSLVWQ